MKPFLLLTVLMVVLGNLFGQSPSNACVKTTEGKDFWFGFMENRPGRGCGAVPENYLEVTVTSRFNCQFNISLGNSSSAIVSDVLQPNVPKKFRIDRSLAEPSGSETIEKKSLHLVSDQPLNLYAMNWGANSADASVIFPIEALGNEYYALCYEPHIVYQTLVYDLVNQLDCGTFITGKNSEFVVVASEDQTQVTITPSKVTDKLKPAGIPFTIVLNKGDLYQVQSMNLENLPGQGDLTGSYIKSNKPIALYSGSWATTIPTTATYALDHLYEQIPPVTSWGRKFVAVPFLSRVKDTYRILASVDHTNIQISNKPAIPPLDKGQFYEFMLNFYETSMINSDQPVLLAQYSNSNEVDRPTTIPAGGPWDGDPSMLIVNPVDQTREESTFIAYDTPEITSKIYVNVVSKNDAVNQIKLDNNPISFSNLPNSGYSYAQVPISIGSHHLQSTETGKGFIAYVYGFGGVESYGYSTGFNMSARIDLGGDLHFVKDTMLICHGESKILDAGSQFSTYKWSTGEITQKITVNQQGHYRVTASTEDGCTVSDSVFIFESNPVTNLGKDSTYCRTTSLQLDAGAGFSSYKWSTNATTQKIIVGTSGVYNVLAINKYGCPARDTVRVGLVSAPKIVIGKESQLICGSLSTIVKISSNGINYKLTSANPTVSIDDLSVTVPGFGNYPFSFTCSNIYGCVSDTTFTIGFFPTPPVSFDVSDTVACVHEEVKFSAISTGNIVDYLWEWGDGTSDHQSQNATHQYAKSGQYDIKLTVNFDNKCSGSIVRKNMISIKSIPTVDFSIQNSQCLKAGNQTLEYTGTGDELDHYNWDLSGFQPGEIIVNPGYARGPLIFDLKSKPYNSLSLQVVSKYGCVSETKSLQLRRNPAFSVFSQDSSGCAPFSVELNAVTNDPVDQVAYSWDYGNGANGIGSRVSYIYVQPKESYDIRIMADSRTTGCRDSLIKSQWISVFPKPQALFTIQNSIGCLNEAFVFNAYDNGAGANYNWKMGDSTTETGQDISHQYVAVGHYDVSLNVVSSHGCTDQSLVVQSVYAASVPTIGFTLDPATCLEPGNNILSYTGTATLNDKFNWDLSQLDPEEIMLSPSTTPGPLIFNLLNKPLATVSLQVVSEYGCKSEKKQLTVRRKPAFSFGSDTSVGCPPLEVNFSATSEDALDVIDYHWNFGDGESMTGQRVTHAFAIPDRYYDLSVLGVSKTTGCSASKDEKSYIRVYPKPQAGFSYSPGEVFNDLPDVSFLDQSAESETYHWDFGDSTSSDKKDPTHKYGIVGALKVKQTVYNQYLCSDSFTMDLIIGLRKLYVPNAFSPSAENAVDREFSPWCSGVIKDGYHLRIFSRWNDVVFDCKNEIKGWDGKLQNGLFAPPGNYVWILDFLDFEGKAHRQNGTVMLIY